jgi:hypothetical protein
MTEAFGDRTSYAAPVRLAELEYIQQQRQAARLVCAANAIGRTRVEQRADLAELLAMLGLYPADDPTAEASSSFSSVFPVTPFS